MSRAMDFCMQLLANRSHGVLEIAILHEANGRILEHDIEDLLVLIMLGPRLNPECQKETSKSRECTSLLRQCRMCPSHFETRTLVNSEWTRYRR